MTSIDRRSLRAAMRRQRQNLPPNERSDAAVAVMKHLRKSRVFQHGMRVATYIPIDGELDPTLAARYAARLGCRLYVPRIVDMRARRMEFVAISGPVARLTQSSASQRRIDPRNLDVVLVPLVAFDVHGHRVGFGAGFYDRKFSFLRNGYRRRPLLIGIGFHFQQIEYLPPTPWDVRLHAIVSERGLVRCRSKLTGSKGGI